MGGSESKTVVSNLSETVTKIAVSTVQSCEIISSQEQELNYTNNGWSFGSSTTMEQETDIRAECFSDVSKQVQLQNQIINTIKQTSTSDSIAVLGAFGSSTATAEAHLSNIVRNNVTMSNIQKSYTEIKQKQKVTYTNNGISAGDSFEMRQGAQVFAAATLKEMDKAGIFNSIATYVDQKSKASQENPLDFIAKIVGAVSSSIAMSIIFFVVIIAAVVLGFSYLGGGGSESSDNGAGDTITYNNYGEAAAPSSAEISDSSWW